MCTCTDASNMHATIYVCLPTRWTSSGYVSATHVHRAPALGPTTTTTPRTCSTASSRPSHQASHIRTTSSKLLTPTIRRVATMTTAMTTVRKARAPGNFVHLQDLTSASKMDVRSTCKRALGKPNHLHVYASRTDLTSLLPVDIFTPRRLLQPCKRTIMSTSRSVDSSLRSSPDPPTPPVPTPTSLVVLSCQTNRAVK